MKFLLTLFFACAEQYTCIYIVFHHDFFSKKIPVVFQFMTKSKSVESTSIPNDTCMYICTCVTNKIVRSVTAIGKVLGWSSWSELGR